jgi:hypothetical protein
LTFSINSLNASLQGLDNNILQNLSSYFHQYSGNDDFANFDWIQNPFKCEPTDLIGREHDEMAELSSDRSLRLLFSAKRLSSFPIMCAKEYPEMSVKALNVLLLFPTT